MSLCKKTWSKVLIVIMVMLSQIINIFWTIIFALIVIIPALILQPIKPLSHFFSFLFTKILSLYLISKLKIGVNYTNLGVYIGVGIAFLVDCVIAKNLTEEKDNKVQH